MQERKPNRARKKRVVMKGPLIGLNDADYLSDCWFGA